MDWAWTSLDQLWRTPAFSMGVTLVAAIFFALVLLAVLFRAEIGAANGVLAIITLLAIGGAVSATVRSGEPVIMTEAFTPPMALLPALSCLDGLAGDIVESACEKVLFASAESSAVAVSYTLAQMNRLASFGDTSGARKDMTPELSTLRRTVKRDRYGLVAHILTVRDGCTPSECTFYKFLSDHKQIAAHMTDKTYQGLIERYALTWTSGNASAPGAPGSLLSPASSDKPISGFFPSSSSIPAVSIMMPEAQVTSGPSTLVGPSSKPMPSAAQITTPRMLEPIMPKKLTPKKDATASPISVPLAPAQNGNNQ